MSQIAVLQEEIVRCLKAQNFSSTICLAFEGGIRQKPLQQGTKLPEDTISNISKTLKLSPLQTAVFAYALMQSQYRALAQDAQKLLKSKLPEMSTMGATGMSWSEVHEDALHGLAVTIASSEELSAPEISGFFMASVRSLPELSMALAALPSTLGSSNTNGNIHLHHRLGETDMDIAQALSASTRQRLSAASILADFGCQTSSNVENFRNILHDVGVVIDEEQLAEIMVTFLMKNAVALRAAEENKVSPLLNASSSSSQSWNLDVVGEVLQQECMNVNWTLVAQRLDQPHLSIVSESEFQRLLSLFTRISGISLPAAGLMGQWDNRAAQMTLLNYATKSLRTSAEIDFTPLVTSDQQLGDTVAFPENLSWVCLPLYVTLMRLAASGLSMEVTEALATAAASYPGTNNSCDENE